MSRVTAVVPSKNTTIHADVVVPEGMEITGVVLQRLIDAHVARSKNDPELCFSIMQNFPEYGMTMDVVDWHYFDKDGGELTGDAIREAYIDFAIDTDLRKEYIDDFVFNEKLGIDVARVTHARVVAAMPHFRHLIDTGKLFFGYGGSRPYDLADAGNWDSEVSDCLMQLCVFGDVILG